MFFGPQKMLAHGQCASRAQMNDGQSQRMALLVGLSLGFGPKIVEPSDAFIIMQRFALPRVMVRTRRAFGSSCGAVKK